MAYEARRSGPLSRSFSDHEFHYTRFCDIAKETTYNSRRTTRGIYSAQLRAPYATIKLRATPTRRSKCASRTRTRTPVLQSTQLKTNFGSTDYYIALVYVSLLCVGSYEVLRTQLRVRIIARTSCHMHTTSLPQSFPNTEAGQSNL